MPVFLFTTPLKPKKNSFRAGIARGGRLYQYRSAGAKNCENALQMEAMVQMRRQGLKMLDGGVHVDAVMKKTRADCIGLLETILDALQKVVYENDRQVVSFSARWSEKTDLLPNLSCQVKVTKL